MYECIHTHDKHVLSSIDCTDIMLDGWIKNILGRRTETSPSRDDDDSDDDVSGASAERLLSTAKPVATFRENGKYNQHGMAIVHMQS